MKTQAKRKLLPLGVLEKAVSLDTIGVPMTRIITDLGLDISRPHLRKLMTYRDAACMNDVVFRSIQPPWLNQDVEHAQIQPDGWIYTGVYPFGEWTNENN